MVENRTASFELIFRPNLELISVVRRFVENFYTEILGNADATFRLALATHELLENAVKYSEDGETTIRIEIRRLPSCQRVAVETINRASEPNVGILRRRFDEMSTELDPFAYYQKLMQRSVRQKEGSGLGIARVRAEAEMGLRWSLQPDNLVHIFADTDVLEERA